jgi:hypothetical protein
MAGAVEQLETDYLVIGTGLGGLAFVDSLIAHSKADVIMVDRRHAPGGHWLDAYPFVQLHIPSVLYGVSSVPLGADRVQQDGFDRGMYERATWPEICRYHERVMQERLLPTGQVRHFPRCEYLGARRFRSLEGGTQYEVRVRRKVVDATVLASPVPANTPAPFQVAADARCVTSRDLASLRERPEGYVIVGGGKTAIDACLWLLEQGTDPDAITWIRPRDCWLLNRAYYQPLAGKVALFEGFVRQLEAAMGAGSADEFCERGEAADVLLRVDPGVRPTMLKGAMTNRGELEQLRRIRRVVRLGHVERIERERLVLAQGEVPTSPAQLHVHCATPGLSLFPPQPIFGEGAITLQGVRLATPAFNSALVGYIESTDRSDGEKNSLCPANTYPDTPLDWLRGMLVSLQAGRRWAAQPDVATWLEGCRLNMMRGMREHAGEPAMQDALRRFNKAAGPALARIGELMAGATPAERARFPLPQ